MIKRFLYALVVLCMAFAFLPVSAKAESPQAQWGVAATDGSKPAAWAGSGTLDDAIAYANGLSGGTAYIQLLSSVTAAETLTFTQGTTTLDLNSCTLGAVGNSGVITLSGGTLTIDDSTVGGNGKVTSAAGANDSGTINVNGGNLVVAGGTVENLQNGESVHTIAVSSGNVTVNGGKVSRENESYTSYTINNIGSGTVTVSDGEVSGGFYTILNKSGTVNVTGGKVINDYYAVYNEGTLSITGGLVQNTSQSSFTIYNAGSGSVHIGGSGEVSGSIPIFLAKDSTGTVSVTGGKVTATNNYAIESQGSGSISVSGGELTGKSNAIRCSEYSTANVSVTGGVLTSETNWTIYNSGTGSLKVTDARVEGKSSAYGAIYHKSSKECTIGGTVFVTSANDSTTAGTVNLTGGWLTIKGGTIQNTNTSNTGYAIFVSSSVNISLQAKSPVIIRGTGSALNKKPSLSNTFVKTAAADVYGTLGVGYDAGNIAYYKYLKFLPTVASTGGIAYATLQEAVNAVADGGKITLFNNTQENVSIKSNNSFQLELNSYTLDGGTGVAIENKGSANLTISDDTGSGAVLGHTGINSTGTGEIIVLSGRIISNGGCAIRGDTVTLRGGRVENKNSVDQEAIVSDQIKIETISRYLIIASSYRIMGQAPIFPDSASYVWRTNEVGAFALGPYEWSDSHTCAWFCVGYTVTYHHGENGAGSQAAGAKAHGESLKLPGAVFTREGYKQTGWATTDGGPQAFALNGSYTDNAAVDLYPVWTINTYTVTLPTGTGYTVTAQDGSSSPVEHGGSYSFTVAIGDGYQKGDDFAVMANGVSLTADGGGVYTITDITQSQTITVEGVVKNTYAVTLPTGTGFTVTAQDGSSSPVEHGGSYRFTVAIADGYHKGDDFAVKANGVPLTANDSGVYTISNITQAQTITVVGVVVKTYTVTLPAGTGYTVTAQDGSSSPVEHGGSYRFTIAIADGHYAGSSFAVQANGVPLTADGSGVYTITDVTQSQTITVVGVVKNTYAVTLPTGTGYTVTAQDGSSSPVTHGGSYRFTVAIADGYHKGDDFAVKANGVPLTADGGGVYTISNITQAQTVTVEGVEQDIPVPTPSPTPPPSADTVYNDPSKADATIWLTGSGFASDDLLMTQELTDGGDYNAMLKLADGTDVFGVYEISLQSGTKSTGSAMHLTFALAEQYAGQTFTLVHKKADGTFEYFYATADADGNVRFGPLYELSPFMLVKGTLLDDLDDIPKTGDDSSPWIWWLLCGASAVGAALLLIMGKRKGRA